MRTGDLNPCRMECDAVEGEHPAVREREALRTAIRSVAKERRTRVTCMHTKLMGAPRNRPKRKKRGALWRDGNGGEVG